MNPQITAGGPAVSVPGTATSAQANNPHFAIFPPGGGQSETFTLQSSGPNAGTYTAASGASASVATGSGSALITIPVSSLYPAAAGYEFELQYGLDGGGSNPQYSKFVGAFDVVGAGGSGGAGSPYAFLSVYSSQGGGLSPQPASAFSQPAPLLYDGSDGDAATGYTVNGGAGRLFAYALVDLGAAAGSVGSFSLSGNVGGTAALNQYALYSSPDGAAGNWTQQAAADQGNSTAPFSVSRAALASPAAARYWQAALASSEPGSATLEMTDFRLYDAGGNPLGGSGGPVTYPARTAAEAGVLGSGIVGEAAGRGPQSLSARAALAALLAQSVLVGAVSPQPPHTSFPARTAVSFLLSGVSAGRGAQSLSPRLAAQPVLAEASPNGSQSLPPGAALQLLLPETAGALPRSFSLRTQAEGVLFSAAARTGRASPPGGTAPPVIAFLPPLLTASASAGPKSFSRRQATLSVLTAGTGRGPLAFQGWTDIAGPVVTAIARAGLLSPAPLPQNVDSRDPFVVLAAEIRFLLAQMQGNPMTTNAALLAIFDKLAASYRVNELSLLANTLSALPTLIRGGDGVSSTQYGFGQDGPILALLPAADSMILGANPALVLAALYRPFLQSLIAYLSKLGFSSLDAYLTSLNTPVPYQGLVHPNFALISYLFNNSGGTLLLSPGNVFAPQATFGSVLAGPAAGALAFTHLSDIPSANVVSGLAGQSAQGYTAAPGVVAQVTTAVTGTLTVTLTAFGQNAAGQAVSGRVWTAVLDNAAAGTTVSFTPGVPGDRIYGITGGGGQGAATAGAFVLASVLERMVS